MKILYTDTDSGYINNNINYIINFQPSYWILAITKTTLYIILDQRYIDKIEKINKKEILEKLKIQKIKTITLKWDLEEILKKITKKSSKIYLEKNVAYFFYEILKKLNKKIIFKNNFFENKRIIKNKNEIKNIKKAIKIIDKVYKKIEKLNKENKLFWKTEKEIRTIIINSILEFGWEKESFESIVAFGKNSAIPHHTTWNTKIKNGPLLIDMWALYNSYCSDFTRTFWVWNKDNNQYKKFKKIYNIVKQAHNIAFESLKPWIKANQIDKLARDYIKSKWYWNFFTHSTWHWLGLNIHEKPWINSKSKTTIKENMFFTIEPGIYLKNEFWIRLENIIHFKNQKGYIYSKIKL
jgi:Xaa-Pro aminopeptidase/Xaa-Pro dipeptidase